MMCRKLVILFFIIFLCIGSFAKADLTSSQKKELFEQANGYFQQANSANDLKQAKSLYEKSILNYQKIIEDGNVKNSRLYYNLANAYFLDGKLGRAILNYRKAEKLDSSDENIKKNLEFARSRRIDKVTVNTEKKVMQTLFFWHYDFSLKTKSILTCIFFGILCLCAALTVRRGLIGHLMIVLVICGVLTIMFLASAVIETKNQNSRNYGVITAGEVVARQGDGQNYPPSFKESLHEGTEIQLIESRPRWYHIKLTDESTAWIPSDTAELI
jgi:tetratricopeptide (TPR) repeat protein